jgi:preprotein translocase subunit SecY
VLTAFARAFRTPDLRKKILFTLGIMALFRLGSVVPTPGVSYQAVQDCIDNNQNTGLYSLINLFSGGALLQLSVFALGIMPYITASIIVQLLIGLAVLQSTGLIALARQPGQLFSGCQNDIIYTNIGIFGIAVMVVTMTAGTGVIMWLGELITDRGIGNGMSLLIFTSIAAGFPTSLWQIRIQNGVTVFTVVVAAGLALVAMVVFVEQAQRRIPVQYAKRMIGRRQYGGSSTYIPLKVNQAGVIPVIFASSLLYLPALAVNLTNQNDPPGWAVWVQSYLVRGDHPIYMALYFGLIVFFTYFYVAITFNPTEVADNMKKYGGFIPGIRAGRPTAEYLDYVLSRITLPGSMYLGAISLIPLMALAAFQASSNFPFGGTAILIIVGVGLETVKQIESQLQQRNYEGFLR